MNNYIQLFKKINIHPLFWAVAGIGIVTGYFWELLGLFFIVFVHECGHAFAAQFFNWKIKRILILPFGGLCEVDEHGNRSMKEEMIIILAGPLQHVFIAILIYILGGTQVISAQYAHLLNNFNLMILLFNLLPIWPLDGGKLVHLLFAIKWPFLQACRFSLISSTTVIAVIHLFILFYSPFNLHLWIVLFYLYFCLWSEWKQYRFTFMRFLLERHYGKNQSFSHLQPIHVNDDDYLHAAMEKFKRGSKHLIHIGGNTIAKLDENELLYAYFTEKQVNARMKDIVYND